MMRELRTVDIFCQVLDNYGDAGVCWRLARTMGSLGQSVTLWVDDLTRLQRLRPSVDVSRAQQALDGFTLRYWSSTTTHEPVADLVICAFGCRLPESALLRMAAMKPAPVWINLEYLSAEQWVEQSHKLPSPHPRLPLVEHFFFPGFTQHTGGLLRETNLLTKRLAFDANARMKFLSQLGVNPQTGTHLVSLFCYPTAPIASLFQEMQSGPPVLCLVPEGVTPLAPASGKTSTQGALTLQSIPFLDPDDYDRLLWSCDLNFVRGEDSASRAQWAAQPMLWQLYPQADRAHLTKLQAFLALYSESLDPVCADGLRHFSDWWNGEPVTSDWPGLIAVLPVLKARASIWQQQLAESGELATGLIEFAREIG
jgi:uncharacterized repeat protein (TIGR03837 family)